MKVLVANRGEIACRVLRTLREMQIPSVAVATDVDRDAAHVWLADEVQNLGETTGYLDFERVLAAALETGATAVHPGYGFLSENTAFAKACTDAGITFIGPRPETMTSFGDKREARQLATDNGVPVIPGEKEIASPKEALAAAEKIGFPVLIKAAAGGGGKGIRAVHEADALADAVSAAQREAQAAFGDGRLLLEKYIHPARHIEVQILGDGKKAIALGERECSLQRRYQKLIEESPSIGIDEELRQQLYASAVKLAEAAGYLGAGTVEFLVGPEGNYYFLEVNSRLQVEHPVTELRTGLDLVKCQIELAQGGPLPTQVASHGHAIEVRLIAEDPGKGFLPSTGPIHVLHWPQTPRVRVDAGIEQGSEVSPHYDSLLAKIIAWGADREAARRALIEALREMRLLGVATNQAFQIDLLEGEAFKSGQTFTTTVEADSWSSPEVPEWVREAAEQGGAAKRRRGGGDGNQGYSPFQGLGRFRMAK